DHERRRLTYGRRLIRWLRRDYRQRQRCSETRQQTERSNSGGSGDVNSAVRDCGRDKFARDSKLIAARGGLVGIVEFGCQIRRVVCMQDGGGAVVLNGPEDRAG